jgi:hypothetical protein
VKTQVVNRLPKPSRRRGKELSSSELAAFLLKIAEMHSDPSWGNEALSNSLRKLAKQLRSRVPATTEGVGSKKRKASSESRLQALHDLSELDIRSFVADMSRTKEELLDLAALRFGMARSQLRRERSEVIRQAIESALSHENSLSIIGLEAAKSGSVRRS